MRYVRSWTAEADNDNTFRKIGKLLTDFDPPRRPPFELFPSGGWKWAFLLNPTSKVPLVLPRIRGLCVFLAPRLDRYLPLWMRFRLF